MPRARSGPTRHRKVRKIMRAARGYQGGRRKYFRTAKNTVAVRMEDVEPRGRRPDPALDAFLASFALER